MLPRAREGHCVLPKSSGVAVPTTRHLLGGVGAHFRGIPLLGSPPPLGTAFYFLSTCFYKTSAHCNLN